MRSECAAGCGYQPIGRKPKGWQCGKCDPERKTEHGVSSLPYRYDVLMRVTVAGDGPTGEHGYITTAARLATLIAGLDPHVVDVASLPTDVIYLGKNDDEADDPADEPAGFDSAGGVA